MNRSEERPLWCVMLLVAFLGLVACGTSNAPASGPPFSEEDVETAEDPASPPETEDGELEEPADDAANNEDPAIDGDPSPEDADDTGDADSGPEDVAPEDVSDVPSPEDTPSDTDETPEPIFAAIWPGPEVVANAETLDLEVVDSGTDGFGPAQVTWQELRFRSWQFTDGVIEPIRIEGWLALPAGTSTLPGVVVAHGLGGRAERGSAVRMARRLQMAVLAYSGPGSGASTGRGTGEPNSLWNTYPDPRGSWFWGHAVAGSRAITALEQTSRVDANRIGMTGYSAGAMATILVNGFDTRLAAALPVSGTGGHAAATAAGGWQNDLLAQEELTLESPAFQRWLDVIDPIHLAARAHAPTLLVNGTQDQFFPIDSTLATFEAFPGDRHRLLLLPNWDHGHFALDMPWCATFDNRTAVARRLEAAEEWWLRRHLTDLPAYQRDFSWPTVEVQAVGGVLVFSAEFAEASSVEEVHVYASGDRAWTFAGTRLDTRQGNRWAQITAFPSASFPPETVVALTSVRVRMPGTTAGELWVTSLPKIPSSFTPRIRPIDPSRCGER